MRFRQRAALESFPLQRFRWNISEEKAWCESVCGSYTTCTYKATFQSCGYLMLFCPARVTFQGGCFMQWIAKVWKGETLTWLAGYLSGRGGDNCLVFMFQVPSAFTSASHSLHLHSFLQGRESKTFTYCKFYCKRRLWIIQRRSVSVEALSSCAWPAFHASLWLELWVKTECTITLSGVALEKGKKNTSSPICYHIEHYTTSSAANFPKLTSLFFFYQIISLTIPHFSWLMPTAFTWHVFSAICFLGLVWSVGVMQPVFNSDKKPHFFT